MVRTYYSKPPHPVPNHSSEPNHYPSSIPDSGQAHVSYSSPLFAPNPPASTYLQHTPHPPPPSFFPNPPYIHPSYFGFYPNPWMFYPPYALPPLSSMNQMMDYAGAYPQPASTSSFTSPAFASVPSSTGPASPLAIRTVTGRPPSPPVVKSSQYSSKPRPASRNFRRAVSSVESAQVNQVTDEGLPWAMGNPQPKTGKRGTQEWNLGQSGIMRRNSIDYGITTAKAIPSFYTMQSASSTGDLNQPLDAPFNKLRVGASPKEKHNAELLEQIEANKRMKEREKQREIEIEMREIKKFEQYNARQKAEEDEEKRRQRDRAIAIERKAARNNNNNNNNQPQQTNKASETRNQTGDRDSSPQAKLEWWERKEDPTLRNKGKSAVIPSLRSKPPSTPTESSPPRSRRSTPTPSSRLSYHPSAGSRRPENATDDRNRPETTESQAAFYEREVT